MKRFVLCSFLISVIVFTISLAASIDKCDDSKLSIRSFQSPEVRSSDETFSWQTEKSLVIAFDTTGSMSDDLAQLRAAAIEIVNELTEKEGNVIENYILSLFNDPTVEEPFVTTDPTELIARLNRVTVSGGGDCPELALQGIKNALEVALPNSLAFIFTDASAKDYDLYDDVAGLIQLKQIRAYFLLTGHCDELIAPGYQVFERIGRVSDGQVFNMNRDEVKDVMLAIRFVLDPDFVSLLSLDYEEAGSNSTEVTIDPSFSSVSVTMSGVSASLTVRDSSGVAPIGDFFSTENIKVMTFAASNTVLTIEASAQSAYSLRITGISAIKFRFGFSSTTPTSFNDTQILPLRSRQNMLSIFVSNPFLIKCMYQVSFIAVDDDFRTMEMNLIKTGIDMYSTNFINIPTRPFKIMAHGIDEEGNVISRLLSTGIGIVTEEVSCSTDCHIDGTGLVPFKFDCTRYYECIKGVKHARACPLNEAYDVPTSSCVVSETARCFRDSCI